MGGAPQEWDSRRGSASQATSGTHTGKGVTVSSAMEMLDNLSIPEPRKGSTARSVHAVIPGTCTGENVLLVLHPDRKNSLTISKIDPFSPRGYS